MSSNRHAVWQVLELIHGDGDKPMDLWVVSSEHPNESYARDESRYTDRPSVVLSVELLTGVSVEVTTLEEWFDGQRRAQARKRPLTKAQILERNQARSHRA